MKVEAILKTQWNFPATELMKPENQFKLAIVTRGVYFGDIIFGTRDRIVNLTQSETWISSTCETCRFLTPEEKVTLSNS